MLGCFPSLLEKRIVILKISQLQLSFLYDTQARYSVLIINLEPTICFVGIYRLARERLLKTKY